MRRLLSHPLFPPPPLGAAFVAACPPASPPVFWAASITLTRYGQSDRHETVKGIAGQKLIGRCRVVGLLV